MRLRGGHMNNSLIIWEFLKKKKVYRGILNSLEFSFTVWLLSGEELSTV